MAQLEGGNSNIFQDSASKAQSTSQDTGQSATEFDLAKTSLAAEIKLDVGEVLRDRTNALQADMHTNLQNSILGELPDLQNISQLSVLEMIENARLANAHFNPEPGSESPPLPESLLAEGVEEMELEIASPEYETTTVVDAELTTTPPLASGITPPRLTLGKSFTDVELAALGASTPPPLPSSLPQVEGNLTSPSTQFSELSPLAQVQRLLEVGRRPV